MAMEFLSFPPTPYLSIKRDKNVKRKSTCFTLIGWSVMKGCRKWKKFDRNAGETNCQMFSMLIKKFHHVLKNSSRAVSRVIVNFETSTYEKYVTSLPHDTKVDKLLGKIIFNPTTKKKSYWPTLRIQFFRLYRQKIWLILRNRSQKCVY